MTVTGRVLLALAVLAAVELPDRALELRNLGYAELENEQPARAEAAFEELAELVPDDPLPWANLAIARLRQQKSEGALEAVDEALALAPGRADLLAIRGEVLQWSGRPADALAAFAAAAEAAPDDPETQYSLLRQSANAPSPESESLAAEALRRLATLRPENVPVLLQLGSTAVKAGDRSAATAAYLRLKELVWQAPEAAGQMLDALLEALEADDLEAARVPALRLENVLKVTPMYREGLRELATGIQGVPVKRFVDEPQPEVFGSPVPVRFVAERIAATESDSPSGGLAVGDFDGDEAPDIAWLGLSGTLLVRIGTETAAQRTAGEAVASASLTAADLDNDGWLDLLAAGPGVVVWRNRGDGTFEDATDAFGLAGPRDRGPTGGIAVLDFDIEGDLDLLAARQAISVADAAPSPPLDRGGLELYLNSLSGPLEPVGERVFRDVDAGALRSPVVSDLDRDGDLDLVLLSPNGAVWLDNLRQGTFADRTEEAGLDRSPAGSGLAVGDLDNDGLPDLIVAGQGLRMLHNDGGSFKLWGAALTGVSLDRVLVEDFDNDGRLDLAALGGETVHVLGQDPTEGFRTLPLEGAPAGLRGLAAADLDADGDVDLVAVTADGLWKLVNQGGNANAWLTVRLRGLTQGNSKNNALGFGAAVEVRAGRAYQLREVASDTVHLGLGDVEAPDLLRVTWTNGVPQNRLAPRSEQRIVEEQLLKGSCPFLYAWNGERIEFVTDLLWAAPIGLPVGPGVWASADPGELVEVTGAAPRNGVYDLRLTEELWEAAFFDRTRLWVVDHPADVEVASNLRVLPGVEQPEEVLATRDLRAPVAAWDAAGVQVTDRVARRDEVYADGWEASPYQGLAAEPWSFTFDLGEAPAAPVRLHLDGWIFPSDASLNLAMAQRSDLERRPTRLEVEAAEGWLPLVSDLGFPAGKTKTMVVDTPPLPPGATRLRIVADLWLSWDRIAWSTAPADEVPRIVARLDPEVARLRFRGYSALVRRAPNAPHGFDYAAVSTSPRWLPFPGRYTRYGDVRELLAASDDRSVVMAAGDEIALAFDAAELPPPPVGWRRTVFLESHGWDKDADRNTWEADQVEPLPFRAMTGYPYGPGESFPDAEAMHRYRAEWLTRIVEPERPGTAGAR
jgi:Tfp pilus assembly protein PilF